jgi:hypothetical protein
LQSSAGFHRQHFVVPKPQHAITASFKLFCTPRVLSHLPGFSVLTAVQLNYQMSFTRAEIDYEFSDRELTSKLCATQLPVAQPIPQQFLCVSLIDAQLASPAMNSGT